MSRRSFDKIAKLTKYVGMLPGFRRPGKPSKRRAQRRARRIRRLHQEGRP